MTEMKLNLDNIKVKRGDLLLRQYRIPEESSLLHTPDDNREIPNVGIVVKLGSGMHEMCSEGDLVIFYMDKDTVVLHPDHIGGKDKYYLLDDWCVGAVLSGSGE